MNPEIVEAFLHSQCYGRDGITSSPIIERLLGICGLCLRQHINLLRRQCKPIASESKGYFYATEAKDLEPTIQHLCNRRAAIDAAIEGLRKAQERLLGLP